MRPAHALQYSLECAGQALEEQLVPVDGSAFGKGFQRLCLHSMQATHYAVLAVVALVEG